MQLEQAEREQAAIVVVLFSKSARQEPEQQLTELLVQCILKCRAARKFIVGLQRA